MQTNHKFYIFDDIQLRKNELRQDLQEYVFLDAETQNPLTILAENRWQLECSSNKLFLVRRPKMIRWV